MYIKHWILALQMDDEKCIYKMKSSQISFPPCIYIKRKKKYEKQIVSSVQDNEWSMSLYVAILIYRVFPAFKMISKLKTYAKYADRCLLVLACCHFIYILYNQTSGLYYLQTLTF